MYSSCTILNRPSNVKSDEFDILFFVFAFSVKKEWNCEKISYTSEKLDRISLSMAKSCSINPITFTITDCTDENWSADLKCININEVTTFELTEERSIIRRSMKQKRRAGSIIKYKFKIGLKELKQKSPRIFIDECGSLPYTV